MHSHLLLAAFAAILLAGCIGNVRQGDTAHYDLGTAAVAWQPAGLPLAGVEASAPSWLGGTAMHYRLLYADARRRQAYGESRWAAPPAELIGRTLNRQGTTAGGCRIKLDLDELAQVFATPQSSRMALDARAALLTPRGEVLARKSFAVSVPAPRPDAVGGAAAAADAVQSLGGEIGAWVTQTARELPTLTERCKG